MYCQQHVVGGLRHLPGAGWPGEVEIRIASRPPTYALERAGVGALGFEGDVLLGWRGGDAIGSELG